MASPRSAVVVCGGGFHQAALQEPSGGHGAQRLPVPEEAGRPAHQAHRRDPGHAAGDAGGHDHRWVVVHGSVDFQPSLVGGIPFLSSFPGFFISFRELGVRGGAPIWACAALTGC